MVNVTNYVLSLPLILLALFAVGTLVMDRMFPPEWKWLNAVTALIGIAFAAGGVAKIQYTQAQLEMSGIHLEVGFQHALVVDSFALFFYYLLLAGGGLAVLIAVRRAPPEAALRGTFYAALLCCLIGLMCMVSGFHLGLIFGGVVLSEVAACTLVRILSRVEPGRSAARRYLLGKILSSAVLGLGFLLLRMRAGSAGLHEVRQAVTGLAGGQFGPGHRTLAAAFALTVAGLVLKIAAVPFHQWNRIRESNAGDSEDNDAQPAIVQNCLTGFLSAALPAAAWAMSLHIFLWGFYPLGLQYAPWLVWTAMALLAVGALAMLLQTDLRRLVAYSALPAAGVMSLALAAVAASDPFSATVRNGLKSILVYLPAIVFMNLGALAVLASLRQRGIGGEIGDLRGLFWRLPLQASLLLVFLLSIVGIPPLAGFYGKYFAYLSLTASGHRVLVGFGAAFIVLVALCLVRITKAMLASAGGGEDDRPVPIHSGAWVAMLLCALVTVVAGVHPQFLTQLASWAMHLG